MWELTVITTSANLKNTRDTRKDDLKLVSEQYNEIVELMHLLTELASDELKIDFKLAKVYE